MGMIQFICNYVSDPWIESKIASGAYFVFTRSVRCTWSVGTKKGASLREPGLSFMAHLIRDNMAPETEDLNNRLNLRGGKMKVHI